MGLKEYLITKIVVTKIKESAMWKALEGKKSFIVAGLTLAFGALDVWNQYCGGAGCKVIEIPAIVFTVLGALGLWTRSVAKPK